MKFLDALERLRHQAYPTEDMVTRRYEILQRFIEGVRNPDLRRNLATMYAHERYLEEPPTVEELRFATQQYLRTRGPSLTTDRRTPQGINPQISCSQDQKTMLARKLNQ